MTVLRLDHALAAAAVLLAALAGWPWLAPPIPQTRPLAPPSATTAAPPAAPSLPPLASFSATVDRPLFSPSRRPPPGAAAGPAIESRYRLLGIVATGAKKTAFVADNARRAEIGVGDMLDGWTVKEIGRDWVMLVSPAGETVLRLKSAPPEPPKPQ